MSIKPGQKVKIKDAETIRGITDLDCIEFAEPDMSRYCNMYATVIKTYSKDVPYQFFLDIDNGIWVWDEQWLIKSIGLDLPKHLFEL